MNLNGFEGNEKLIQRLIATINNETLSHAYIFEGEAALDKVAFTKAFIKAILCEEQPGIGCDTCSICRKIEHDNYEDLLYVEADGKSIKDEAIEKLQERLKVKPYGKRNIALINNADTMTLRAQNRLLKTLEEPAKGTVLILLSENIENLTNTILSRCVKFRLNYYGRETYDGLLDKAEEVAELLMRGAPFYQRKEAIVDIVKDDNKVMAFLDALEKVYRDFLIIPSDKGRLYKKSQIYKNVSLIEETRRQLLKGVSKNYALKDLMIKIGG